MIFGDDIARFWSKVDRSALSPGGCWQWTGSRDEDGYGRITVNGKRLGAHRMSYRIANGDIPRGLHVLHRCDNPRCVNPDHLRIGTHAENMAERSKRRRTAAGERNGRACLGGPKWARAIRDLYAAGDYSLQELGEMFLIEQRTVLDIVKGRLWKNA